MSSSWTPTLTLKTKFGLKEFSFFHSISMSKSAMKSLVSRLDGAPGVPERGDILANVEVESQNEGVKESFTHWNLLNEALARALPFGPELATAEAVCRWTKMHESKLNVASRLLDVRNGDWDWYPQFPVVGVAACAAVHRDIPFLKRMYTEMVFHLDPLSDTMFAVLTVAGLLRTPELVEMLLEWDSKSKWGELFDVGEWQGLLLAALWTGDRAWSDWCRSMIDERLQWHEYSDVECEVLRESSAKPKEIVNSWRSGRPIGVTPFGC